MIKVSEITRKELRDVVYDLDQMDNQEIIERVMNTFVSLKLGCPTETKALDKFRSLRSLIARSRFKGLVQATQRGKDVYVYVVSDCDQDPVVKWDGQRAKDDPAYAEAWDDLFAKRAKPLVGVSRSTLMVSRMVVDVHELGETLGAEGANVLDSLKRKGVAPIGKGPHKLALFWFPEAWGALRDRGGVPPIANEILVSAHTLSIMFGGSRGNVQQRLRHQGATPVYRGGRGVSSLWEWGDVKHLFTDAPRRADPLVTTVNEIH